MKVVGIDHTFVEDHSVSLAFFAGFQSFGASLPFDLMWIAWFFQRFGNFVDDVGFKRVKCVLGASAYLALHFSILPFVAVQ